MCNAIEVASAEVLEKSTGSLAHHTLANVAALMRNQGFASIADVASEDDLVFIREKLNRLWRERVGYKEGAQFDMVGDGQGEAMSFPQILKPSIFEPGLMKTEFFQKARGLAEQILGPEVRFIGDHALLKPAHTGPITPWHQDEAFDNPAFEYKTISIWLALNPTTIENGCMHFIPKSDAGEVLMHRRLNGDPRIQALECISEFDKGLAVACELPAGGVTIHSNRVLHYAGPNISQKNREAYVVLFGLTPCARKIPRNAPWLAVPSAREERERIWLKRGGLVVHAWRRLQRFNLRDWRQVSYIVRRGYITVMTLVSKNER